MAWGIKLWSSTQKPRAVFAVCVVKATWHWKVLFPSSLAQREFTITQLVGSVVRGQIQPPGHGTSGPMLLWQDNPMMYMSTCSQRSLGDTRASPPNPETPAHIRTTMVLVRLMRSSLLLSRCGALEKSSSQTPYTEVFKVSLGHWHFLY